MNLYQINPYIRLATHSLLQEYFHLRNRAIYDYELLYVQDGLFRLHYNGVDYTVKQGDLLLIHPGISHSFHNGGTPLVQPHIHFDLIYDKQSKSVPISFKPPEQMTAEERVQIREDILLSPSASPFITVSQKEEFLAIFFEIINRQPHKEEMSELICKSLMLRLLHEIIQENYSDCFCAYSPKPTTAETIKNYIDANYQTGVDMAILTSMFHFSRSYIEKCFKEKYGITAIRYANMLRMQQAKLLLEDKSVTEVAALLGYSSIYAFSRAFHSTCGMSPTEYIQSR